MRTISAGLTLADDSGEISVACPCIAQHQLDNGLQILVQSDFTAPVVSIQFWCATGSIHEGEFLGAGISHLLEHLMFKGTPTRGNSVMAQTIQDLGGHLNAYTSFDRTVYHVDLPVEGWKAALEILGDAIFNSLIPADEFEREKEVIRREFAMGRDNPDRELSKLLFETVFTRHPYRFPVIGHLDLFNQLTREDVLKYYHSRYAVQNITLIVCGAVQGSEVFAEAEKLVGSVSRRMIPDIYLPEEPSQLSPRLASFPFPTQLSRLALCHHIPGIHHEDIPALDVLSILMGAGRSSRLHQLCVEKNGVAEEIEAFTFSPAQCGVWGIEARYRPEKKADLLTIVREEVERIKNELPTPEELERAKRLSLVGQFNSMKTMSGKASSIGRGWLTSRDPLFGQHFLDRLQQVTLKDTWRVASKYLCCDTENLVELFAAEAKSKTISNPQTLDKPAPIEKQVVKSKWRTLYLPSHQLPLISFRALFGGGLLAEPDGLSGINYLTTQLLIKGTKRRTAEQISQDVEQLGGMLQVDSGNNSATLGLELLSRDWEQGLSIFLELLTETSFSATEMAIEKRKQAATIALELDHPMAIARNLMRETLYPNHPYASSPLGNLETLEKITLQDIQKFAQNHFFTPDFIFGVTGSVPPDKWSDLLAKRLESWTENKLETRVDKNFVFALKKPIQIEHIVAKEQAVIQVGFPTVPLSHEDQIPLSIIDEALSDLGSRLFIKIREELGLAYFVGASQFLGAVAGHFVFYAGTDPKKRKEIEKVMLEQISLLAKKGLTKEEVERARAKLLSVEKIESQNPAHVVYRASIDELYGLGYDYSETRVRRLSEISLDEVNAVANNYFSGANYAVVTVTPESN